MNSIFRRRERFAIAVASLVAFALRIPLAFRSERMLTQLPYGDDAFYLFSIAKNFAKGLGVSADGVHLTNGFQPLSALLYVPLFWLAKGDAWLAVRYSFFLNGLIAAISVWTVAYTLRILERGSRTSISVPVVGTTIWTLSILVFLHTTNGLETGLYSLFILIALALYVRLLQKNDLSSAIFLGIALGLTVLSRIDAAIWVAILAAWELFQKRGRNAIVIPALSLFVSAPWWYFNLHHFGSLIPISGQAERAWPDPPIENLRRTLQAILDIILTAWYAPDDLTLLPRIIALVAAIGIIVVVVRRLHLAQYLKQHSQTTALFSLGIFSIVLLLYYSIFFGAPHFMARYLQPMRIFWIILLALVSPKIFEWITSRATLKIVSLLVCTGMLAFGANRYYLGCFTLRKSNDFYPMGQFALEHPSDTFGMLQSGIAGFVAPNVVNLDGKVNAEALWAHQQGRLGRYMRDEHFTYLADWKPLVEDLAALARKDELIFDSVGMVGNIQLMRRRN